jgi:hypothetical protein
VLKAIKSKQQVALREILGEDVQRNSVEVHGSMLRPPDYLPPGIRQAQALAKTQNLGFLENLGPVSNMSVLPLTKIRP